METITNVVNEAKSSLQNWQESIKENIYQKDTDFIHSIKLYFPENFTQLNAELEAFGQRVSCELEPLVSENNLAINLPRLENYNQIGQGVDEVVHHPTYIQAGDIIYQSSMLKRMRQPGGLLECLSFLFLSSQAGEAGHNCPIACSAGIIRVLTKIPDFPQKEVYLDKLTTNSYQTNYTGAQFLTEIQGGSDVGQNAVYATPSNKNIWRIYGEKWFCSNAGADLIFLTARSDQQQSGTKGLSLFLVPARWEHKKNHYHIRRLKNKIGTRSMATGEIDFQGAYAFQVGSLEEGFHLVMNNVLHLSRLFNSFCVVGMARRAYHIAKAYAEQRIAFGHSISQYPLVQETLAQIKSENNALLSAIFAIAHCQDKQDREHNDDKNSAYLLRLLVNIQKYLTALWSVEHIHLALGVLAGNGTIETFSPIPRLLRDCIVCETWEGTHNVLRMQVLKDIQKYHVDKLFINCVRNEISQLSHVHERQILLDEVSKLEQQIQDFHALDISLQSLHIRFIVDRMAIVYCAVTLLREALDQAQSSSSHSKLDSYHFFVTKHLTQTVATHDSEYLERIRRIVFA